VAGCAFIPASRDGDDTQPFELVTVKVYVPGERPEMVVVEPLPVTVLPPGLTVTVHGLEGKPLKNTLPVATAQVGCVMVPITGAVGDEGGVGIVTSDDGDEVHPARFVTV
jgi:hypothetical protein